MGLQGFQVLGWFAVMAPAKTPPEVVRFLNAELNKMTSSAATVQRFQALGAEPMGGSPADAAAFVKSEQDKWARVIRDAGIQAQ